MLKFNAAAGHSRYRPLVGPVQQRQKFAVEISSNARLMASDTCQEELVILFVMDPMEPSRGELTQRNRPMQQRVKRAWRQ